MNFKKSVCIVIAILFCLFSAKHTKNKAYADIRNNFSKNQEKPIVEVFEGKEGLKTVLNDIVKTGKNAIGWGHTTKVKKYLPNWFLEKYLKERDKKGIKVKQLYTKGEKVLRSKKTEFKELPKEFSSPVTFGCYGDKIIIFFWSEIPVVIRVINKEVANSFKNHFEVLWNKVN